MVMAIRELLKSKLGRRRVLRAGLSVLIASYLAFCTYFYFFQEWHLLEPNTVPTGGRPSELKEEPFELAVQPQDGRPATIHYRKYVTSAEQKKGVVFYLHGNKGNMDLCEYQIEFLITLGYDVWTMDYRGYGDSKGKISEAALKKDAMAVYEKIAAEIDAESIVIWGRSWAAKSLGLRGS